MRRFAIVSVSFTSLLISCSKTIDTSAVNGETVSSEAAVNDNGEFVPNELLVKFKPGTSQSAKDKALSRVSGKVSEKILTKAMQRFNDKEGLMLVHTPLAVLEAKNKVKGLEVEYADICYRWRIRRKFFGLSSWPP